MRPMNGLERITATVGFGRAERTPVVAQAFGHAAALAGVPLADYLQDGALLADCQLQALARYGYDAVFALMDVNVETEALGSELAYRPNAYPALARPCLASAAGLARLRPPDPSRDGRMPELLKAASILRRAAGDEVLVVGCVMGPLTLALQMMGVEPALYLAVDDPAGFERLLDFAAEVAIAFGVAQIGAGAHLPLIFDPSASPLVVPPQFFREFEAPRLTRVVAAFKAAGALAAWLHIAGPSLPILPHYPAIGVDIANIDYLVDPVEAMRALPHTCINGNLRPLSMVVDSPDRIAQDCVRLLQLFGERGGFILSPGCEAPPESRPENIAAMVAAAKDGARG